MYREPGRQTSLCRGDERGRLLRVLSKSIFGLRGLFLKFRGRGVDFERGLSCWSWQSVRRLKVLYFTARVCFGRGWGWKLDGTSGGVLSWFCVFEWPRRCVGAVLKEQGQRVLLVSYGR